MAALEREQTAALVATSVASFLVPFMSSSINVALPAIGVEFGADAVALSWVATSFILASAMVLVPAGRAADILGRKKLFVAGSLVYAVASVLCAAAGSVSVLIAGRVVQGIGSAMTFATAVALLVSLYPPEKRGRVLGINVAAVYLGLSLGPALGGLATQHLGWRSLFWSSVPLGLLTALVAAFAVRGEWHEAKGEKFDWTGSLLFAASVLGLMYGLTLLPQAQGAAMAGGGIAGIIAFALLQARSSSPVFPVRVFRGNAVFTMSNLAALVNYSATAATGFLLSLYLQNVRGLSPQAAGAVLLAQPLMMAVFSPTAGRLSERIEPRVIASTGMALTAAGLALLAAVGEGTPLPYVVAALLVLGFGFALFSSPNTNAVMSSVDRPQYGVASATLGTMRSFGQMLSMGVAALLIAVVVGRVPLGPPTATGLVRVSRIAFAGFAALCVVGVFLSLARGRLRDRS